MSTRRTGMGGHQATVGKSVEWYTPRRVFAALGLEFDLDPCSPAGGLPWVPAGEVISLPDDGLCADWHGRVWLNPPYGSAGAAWLRRLAEHGQGVALTFARTDTEWWHEVVPGATAVCFLKGRLTFVDRTHTPGKWNGGAPNALIAWGEVEAQALARSGLGMTFRLGAVGEFQGSLFAAVSA